MVGNYLTQLNKSYENQLLDFFIKNYWDGNEGKNKTSIRLIPVNQDGLVIEGVDGFGAGVNQVGTAAPAAPVAPAAASTSQPQAAPKADKSPAQQTANISAAEMQNIVNTALDAKLGPIRKELAEMRVARPGFSEIFGGIGWLVGLAGIALYFKGRRG